MQNLKFHNLRYSEFEQLRLSYYFTDGLKKLKNWEYLDRYWTGEALGFTEFLLFSDRPDALGVCSLDLDNLPEVVSGSIFQKLQLPLRRGMKFGELKSVLGEASDHNKFVPDREDYTFNIGTKYTYTIECTVHTSRGLIYFSMRSFE